MNTLHHLRPLALVAAVLTLTTATTLAKPGGRGPRGGQPGRGLPAELVQKYDANGDGQLDETERAALHADVQAGKITPPGRPGGPGGFGGPGRHGAGGPPPEIVAKFDANGDGQLDATEREALHQAVQAGEVQPPRHGRRGGPGAVPPGMREMIREKFDTNQDGVLDETERQAMHAARQAGELTPPPAPKAPEAPAAPASGPTVIRKPRRN